MELPGKEGYRSCEGERRELDFWLTEKLSNSFRTTLSIPCVAPDPIVGASMITLALPFVK